MFKATSRLYLSISANQGNGGNLPSKTGEKSGKGRGNRTGGK